MSSLIALHYGPFSELNGLLDDAFNTRFSSAAASSAEVAQRVSPKHPNSFRPSLDLHESKDSNTVTATFELPGLRSEDIIVDLQHNRLTVSGESAISNASEEGGHSIHERRYGKFSRTLRLPFGTKAEDVKAKMENGLLTLTFPKTTPEQQPHSITIQ